MHQNTITTISISLVILFSASLLGAYTKARDWANELRKSYVSETENYVSKNREALDEVFVTLFDKSKACTSEECCRAIAEGMKISLTQNIRNFEQIYFIRPFVSKSEGPIIEQLFLDGRLGTETANYNNAPQNSILFQRLTKEIQPQAMYWWPIVSKDGYHIMVPYTIKGETVGAIVRITKENRAFLSPFFATSS